MKLIHSVIFTVVIIAVVIAVSASRQINTAPIATATIPICADSGGQHLNSSAGSLVCGTSTPTGMVVQSGAVVAGHDVSWQGTGQIQDTGAIPAAIPLTGTSATQNPGPLTLGVCNTFTITVTGATTGQSVMVSPIGGVTLGAAISVKAAITSANTVTVDECALAALTPTSAQFRAVVQ